MQVPEGGSGTVSGVSGTANSAATDSTAGSTVLLVISAVTSAAVSDAYFARAYTQSNCTN